MELPCATILYRAITNIAHIDEDREETGRDFKSGAFLLKSEEESLSTHLANGWGDPKEYVKDCEEIFSRYSSQKKCCAVATLHVGRIRSIGLQVKLDESSPNSSPNHVSILGIPNYKKSKNQKPADIENMKRAEDIAGLLAAQARLKWPES